MSSTKQRLFIGVIAAQTALIIFLASAAVYFKVKGVGVRAEADSYLRALAELHEDHEEALTQILLYEREELEREYLSTLDVAVKYGVVTEQEAAARRISAVGAQSRPF